MRGGQSRQLGLSGGHDLQKDKTWPESHTSVDHLTYLWMAMSDVRRGVDAVQIFLARVAVQILLVASHHLDGRARMKGAGWSSMFILNQSETYSK